MAFNKIDRVYQIIEKELITGAELHELMDLVDVEYFTNKIFKNCNTYHVKFDDDNGNKVCYKVYVKKEEIEEAKEIEEVKVENEDIVILNVNPAEACELIEDINFEPFELVGYAYFEITVDIEHDYITQIWGVTMDHSAHDFGISRPLGNICFSDLEKIKEA